MTNHEWCDHVCRRLSLAIARKAPLGIGAWEGAWAMAEPPSRTLWEALERVEAGGGSREEVVRLAQDVLTAWRRAGMRWSTRKEGVA